MYKLIFRWLFIISLLGSLIACNENKELDKDKVDEWSQQLSDHVKLRLSEYQQKDIKEKLYQLYTKGKQEDRQYIEKQKNILVAYGIMDQAIMYKDYQTFDKIVNALSAENVKSYSYPLINSFLSSLVFSLPGPLPSDVLFFDTEIIKSVTNLFNRLKNSGITQGKAINELIREINDKMQQWEKLANGYRANEGKAPEVWNQSIFVKMQDYYQKILAIIGLT